MQPHTLEAVRIIFQNFFKTTYLFACKTWYYKFLVVRCLMQLGALINGKHELSASGRKIDVLREGLLIGIFPLQAPPRCSFAAKVTNHKDVAALSLFAELRSHHVRRRYDFRRWAAATVRSQLNSSATVCQKCNLSKIRIDSSSMWTLHSATASAMWR